VLGTIDRADIPADSLLFWSFAASNVMIGSGHISPVTYKTLDLQSANLEMQITDVGDGTHSVTVSSSGLALFVVVEADVKGRYSENVFDLTAGESRTVIFTPDDRRSVPIFRCYDLQSCQDNRT
jgi:beta-mannosidase